MSRRHAPFGAIRAIANDESVPLGDRLTTMRQIEKLARDEQRRLEVQLGVDLAKHLFAQGIEPTGRPLSETLGEGTA